MANPILNAKNFAKITGLAVAAVALLGIVLSSIGTGGQFGFFCTSPTAMTCQGAAAHSSFLGFDWTHNILHVVLACVGLYIGFMATANMASLYAKVFGIVYFLLGVVGFIPGVVTGLNTALALHLELGENLIHILIGAWGIAAGFLGATATTGTPNPTATPKPR